MQVLRNYHFLVNRSRLLLPDFLPSFPLRLLPNQTWVRLPVYSKAKLLSPGCGEGKSSVTAGHQVSIASS